MAREKAEAEDAVLRDLVRGARYFKPRGSRTPPSRIDRIIEPARLASRADSSPTSMLAVNVGLDVFGGRDVSSAWTVKGTGVMLATVVALLFNV